MAENSNLKLIGYGIVVLVVALILYGISINSDNCFTFDEFLAKGADGRVSSKYIDVNNHNYKIVEVSNHDGTRTALYLTYFWNSNLYDSIEVGYVIKKDKGSTEVLYGKEALTSRMNIHFNCDSIKSLDKSLLF